MKNMSKRVKIILGIVGIVVVVAVIGLVITQPPASELFGAAVLTITPSNPTIAVGASATLVTSANLTCNWSTSNPAVVAFSSNETLLKVLQIKGIAPGTSTIKADCGPSGGYQPTTNVKVMGISPANPSVDVGKTITLNAINVGTAPNCTWTSSSLSYAQLSNATANSVVVKGYQTGSATITAKCSVGTFTKQVTMTNPTSVVPQEIVNQMIYLFRLVGGNTTGGILSLKAGSSVTMSLDRSQEFPCDVDTDNPNVLTISNRVTTTNLLTFKVTGKGVGQAKLRACYVAPGQPIDLMVINTGVGYNGVTCMVNPDYGNVDCTVHYDELLPPADVTITVN